MQYLVVQDIPGRLRVRFGRGLLGDAQAAGITEELSREEGIDRVRVAPANGSVLVEYAPGDDAARDGEPALGGRGDALLVEREAHDRAAVMLGDGQDGVEDLLLAVG